MRRLAVLLALAMFLLGGGATLAVSPTVVVSQVYGGGGNAGAQYTNDYIELFNRGTTSVSLEGWSLQYASATGTGNFGANSGQLTELSGTLAAGQYLLVQEASGGTSGAALPTSDLTDTTPINLSGSAGKVALVNTTTSLGCNGGSAPCSGSQLAQIVDLVGYGGANFYEGAGAAPTLTNIIAAFRAAEGCTDTDNNAADFTAAAPLPRNSASPLHSCLTDTAPAVSATSPAADALGVALDANVTITFSEPVNVAGSWFGITCSTSGTHTAVVTGGPTSFTLDPETNFVKGESCTVTISTTGVSDQDTIDPPDAMVANYTFAFQTYACSQPYTPISDIQGSGLATPIPGTVTTEGVVVGDFEGSSGLGGFYLQDPDGDGNTATSDGVFVYTGSADQVTAGDRVRVSGYARERFDQTTINGSNSNSSAVASIEHCGTGTVTPTDVEMPFADATYPERFEGMLVRFPQPLVISEYFNYDRFGELVLGLPLAGESRPFTPTAVEQPGDAANARALANSLRRITLDDGVGVQNPAVLRHPNGFPFSLANTFRGGDLVQNTVGVLGYDFSIYRIQPTAGADYTAANPRPAAPEPVGGTLRVASMNTLNFFVTPDYPSGNPLDNTCGPLQNVECRGWDSDQPTELTRQRDKLVSAIAGLDAGVVGLNELENTAGVDALTDADGLVPALNAKLGAGTYAAIDTGTIGGDTIRVGLIYRPDEVTPVGAFKVLTAAVDPRFLDDRNRPALAQTFDVNATGARFTVVVNHLKSKGSACDGDPDTGDGQGNCNLTRTDAARALVDWLATDPTGSGDADFLVVGDLNSYAMEDPIAAITAGPDDTAKSADDYTNLVAKYQGTYAYSYVFDGQAGYLDHALASSHLARLVTGATEWHANADEPDVLDYDTSFKPAAQDALYEPNAYRSTDHDPVVVGINLADDVDPTLTVSVSPSLLKPPNHKYVTVTATAEAADNLDESPTVELVSVVSNEPDDAPGGADGATKNDIVKVDDFTFQLRAERNENGSGRVYTITYRATDGAGNSVMQSATVSVPVR